METGCRDNGRSWPKDLPPALRLLASASGGRSGQGRVLQKRPRPFRPPWWAGLGEASRAGSAGRSLQGGADGAGRGLGDSDSPRTGQELPLLLLPPASSRSQRFLTGDRTRPPCPPQRRLMGWVWSGHTMAVSAGGLWGARARGQARVFPGAQPGGCSGWPGTTRTRKSSPAVWLAERLAPEPSRAPEVAGRNLEASAFPRRCGRGAPPSASAA